MQRVYMYSRFLRLWHWLQALLVLTLLATGFEVHGTYQLFGYEAAAGLHRFAAWTLLGLWVLARFWHLTTGEWKQYIPSPVNRILAMLRYYGLGIFRGEPHPFHKDRWHRHNPLQRMAYLSLHVMIAPILWISGLAYLFYPVVSQTGLDLSWIALLHTLGAYLMIAFLVAHLYLALTTSHKPLEFLRGMVTGYEEVEEEKTSA